MNSRCPQKSRPTHSPEFKPFAKCDTEQSLPDRFFQQVRQYPKRPAIDSDAETLTYSELDCRSNKVANALLEGGYTSNGVGPIALLFGHNSYMVVAMIGVLKAGQAYVPLDPSYPASRLKQIIKNAQVSVVLTEGVHEKIATELPGRTVKVFDINRISRDARSNRPDVSVYPDQVAYIFYTSGSTATPKGVIQSHHNVLCNIRNYTNDINIGAEDRLSLLTPFSFAASVSDLFGGLMNGATVCLFDLKRHGIQSCIKWLQNKKITIYYSVPSVFRLLVSALDEPVDFSFVRVVKLGGDSITCSDYQSYRQNFSNECILYIVLGATEINLISRYIVDKETEIPPGIAPVGFPPEDVELLLLDDKDNPVPKGAVGNLVVRSAHVTSGYWNEPTSRESRIEPDSNKPNLRLFKTGDLGRFLTDGRLIHLGRSDSRIKINGQSVALREVEAVLARAPTVREAAVVARPDNGRTTKLIACIVGENGINPSTKQLRDFLRQNLPLYMIPSKFFFVDAFEYTPNGKLDRVKLSNQIPNVSRFVEDRSNIISNQQLKRVLLIWRDSLGVKLVGAQDDFFELGGDSLLAFKILGRVKKEFDVEISPKTFFDNPTPTGLFTAIEKLLTAPTTS